MIKMGDRVETCNFGWAEAVTDAYEVKGKKSRGGWVDVKFDNTGNVRQLVNGDFFKQGGVRDGSIEVVFEIGQVWNTNKDGRATVIELIDNRHLGIKFVNTDNTYTCQKDALLRGFVKDRPAIHARLESEDEKAKQRAIEFAERVKRNKEVRLQQQMIIQSNKEERERRVEQLRLESHERWLAYKKAESKRIVRNQELIDLALSIVDRDTDEYVSSKGVLDIDFKDRDGKWVLRYKIPKEETFIQTRLGKIHNNFTQRANKDGAVQNKYGKAYFGVTASELFLDAQKFADWAVVQPGWNLGYQLEKDLLVEGNREYGEDVCCFLPLCINQAIKSSSLGAVKKSGDFFAAFTSLGGERISIGRYGSKEEAEEAVYEFKRKRLYKLAKEYQESIDPRAYQRLINF